MAQRSHQLVIFGASGFTGKIVIEDLVRYITSTKSNLRWAAAGRNAIKIQETLDQVSRKTNVDLQKIPIITASISDHKSLQEMASSASVVMNCTGPFRQTGLPVVDACVKMKTDYLDIAGEPQFMEEAQLNYFDAAKQNGTFVVPGSGFDCVPGDCGVNYLKDNFKGKLVSVESFIINEKMTAMTGNITTWYSAIEGLGASRELIDIRKKLMKKLFSSVTATRKITNEKCGLHPKRSAFSRYQDDNHSGWILPFKGADPSVMRRTQMHNQVLYGEKPCLVQVYSLMNLVTSFRWAYMGAMLYLFSGSEQGRRLLSNNPKLFTAGMLRDGGPDEAELTKLRFCLTIRGRGFGDNELQPKEGVVRIRGPHPGYPGCAICVNQAAVTMLEERHLLPSPGGVFTPGTAFRKTTIMQRLENHGLDIDLQCN
jgi:short subunit dehydrogenase-like uncharacterized protein